MSDIEKEVLKVTKLKAKKKEPRQKFLKRVVDALEEVDDDDWESLSTEAQKWCNAATKAVADNKSVPEFPDVEDSGAPEDKATPEPEPAKKPKKTKKAKKDTADKPKTKKAKSKKAKKKKSEDDTDTPKGRSGVKARIKQLLYEDPKVSVEDLESALGKEGFPTSTATIRAVRSDTRHTLKVLQDMGALKKNLDL